MCNIHPRIFCLTISYISYHIISYISYHIISYHIMCNNLQWSRMASDDLYVELCCINTCGCYFANTVIINNCINTHTAVCTNIHAEGQKDGRLGAGPGERMISVSALHHLLSAVVQYGLITVSISQQQSVRLPGGHVPHTDTLRGLSSHKSTFMSIQGT